MCVWGGVGGVWRLVYMYVLFSPVKPKAEIIPLGQ